MRRPAGLVGLGLAAAALAAAALPARAADPARLPVPGGVGVAVRLDPASHLFGDAVEATVEVLVDPARVAAGSVRLDVDFSPYRLAARPA